MLAISNNDSLLIALVLAGVAALVLVALRNWWHAPVVDELRELRQEVARLTEARGAEARQLTDERV